MTGLDVSLAAIDVPDSGAGAVLAYVITFVVIGAGIAGAFWIARREGRNGRDDK
jgi:hypothetical protein